MRAQIFQLVRVLLPFFHLAAAPNEMIWACSSTYDGVQKEVHRLVQLKGHDKKRAHGIRDSPECFTVVLPPRSLAVRYN